MNDSINKELEFDNKRYKDIITPCCNKNNKDGKFVSFKNHPKQYGYCHSCGVTTWPEINQETYYNTQKNGNTIRENTSQNRNTNKPIANKYIDIKEVKLSMERNTDNKLLTYLYAKYPFKKVNDAINLYYVGSSRKGACVFWYINAYLLVQKSKHVWYKDNGKRTDYFKVPYQNEHGYKFCLFGEHLLNQNKKPIILVESEKSAIICHIEFPEYTWLAYSGINGLTEEKIKVLSDRKITIIPDISENAFQAIEKKGKIFKQYNVNYSIVDLTYGLNDNQLKQEGLYNEDVADILLKNDDFEEQDNTVNENELKTISLNDMKEWEEIYQAQKANYEMNEKIISRNEKEAQDLREYFLQLELPTQPIKMDKANTIINVQNYIDNHLRSIENATNDLIARPFIDRLYELKRKLE